MEIGTKLHQLRKLSGMTQEQLAEKLNVSRQTVSKWESGATMPDLDSIMKISRLFHVSLDELLLEGKANASGNDAAITLDDLVKIHQHNRKMTLLLTSGLIFIMVSILSFVYVLALRNSTVSIQYMLYRYFTAGEYSYAPFPYTMYFIPAVTAGVIGIALCLSYIIKSRRGKGK